jgi:hypothetical protein
MGTTKRTSTTATRQGVASLHHQPAVAFSGTTGASDFVAALRPPQIEAHCSIAIESD